MVFPYMRSIFNVSVFGKKKNKKKQGKRMYIKRVKKRQSDCFLSKITLIENKADCLKIELATNLTSIFLYTYF